MQQAEYYQQQSGVSFYDGYSLVFILVNKWQYFPLWGAQVVCQNLPARTVHHGHLLLWYSTSLNIMQFSKKKGANLFLQSKKRQYDQEIENLEKQQKQTIERLEQEHTNRLRDEAKRIKAEQEKELSKFQNMLKNKKKEVRDNDDNIGNKEYGHNKQLRLGLPKASSTSCAVLSCGRVTSSQYYFFCFAA